MDARGPDYAPASPPAGETWLRIELASEPIAGELLEPAEPPIPFEGWLDLVAQLEAARSRSHGEPGP